MSNQATQAIVAVIPFKKISISNTCIAASLFSLYNSILLFLNPIRWRASSPKKSSSKLLQEIQRLCGPSSG